MMCKCNCDRCTNGECQDCEEQPTPLCKYVKANPMTEAERISQLEKALKVAREALRPFSDGLPIMEAELEEFRKKNPARTATEVMSRNMSLAYYHRARNALTKIDNITGVGDGQREGG